MLHLNKIVCASLLVGFGSLAIQAQNLKEGKSVDRWEGVAQGKEINARAYFAPSSIRRNGNVIKLWAKWDFPNGMPRDLLEQPSIVWSGNSIGSFRFHLTLNCKEKFVTGSAIIVYDIYGSQIAEEKGNVSVNESPSSIGNVIFNYFCEREPDPPKTPPTLKPSIP